LLRMGDVFLNPNRKRDRIMELLLESVEGLGESALPGEVWELLQAEKESIAREIIASGPLRHDATSVNESEPWDDATEEIERGHRRALELRLREVNRSRSNCPRSFFIIRSRKS